MGGAGCPINRIRKKVVILVGTMIKVGWKNHAKVVVDLAVTKEQRKMKESYKELLKDIWEMRMAVAYNLPKQYKQNYSDTFKIIKRLEAENADYLL